ncbi:MAG: DMT family transporter [Chloroflexi bacterium]|nr:MAG: DMT family transporter [Chloroflexota bacterium]
MTADEVIGAQVAAPAARPWAGWTLVLLASVVLSTSPVVARGVMRSGMDPALLLMLRFWLATALLGALLALRAPALLRIDRYGLKKCMKAGLLAGLDTLAFFYALQRLDASLAVMLSSFYPLLVLLWLRLRGERFTLLDAIRLAMGIVGVFFLTGLGQTAEWIGMALIGFSMLTYSLFIVVLPTLQPAIDTTTSAFYVISSQTVYFTLFWLVQGAHWQPPTTAGWLAVVWLAVFGVVLHRLLLFAGIARIGSAETALLAPVDILLTIIWSILFLGERVLALQWLGGSLILLSAMLALLRLSHTSLRVRRKRAPMI